MIVDMDKKLHEQVNENNWCKGAGFRDNYGAKCHSDNATSACIMGWLSLRYDDELVDKLSILEKCHRDGREKNVGLVTFNGAPSTTANDIVNLLKEAGV